MTDYKIIECAGGVVKNKNRIALIKMKKVAGWGFPKGGVNENETLIEAAKREIFEEAGIRELFFIKDLGSYQRLAADGQPKILNIHMFLFETTQEEISPIEDDVLGAEWFLTDKVFDFLSVDDDKNFFNLIKNVL